MVYNFALIGAAGYVAPRHLRAIKENGQNLAAALDISDSVGIIDSYFPDAAFFTEFERFDRHSELLRRAGNESRIHYVSICSPNYLHDAHIRFALREGANAICEKPLVLNPWNAEALKELEVETGCKVNTILQLRLHPSIIELKNKVQSSGKLHNLELTYITPRGKWYNYSWKSDLNKSGGVATNIGIHFFDMLIWIFGPVKKSVLHYSQFNKAAGLLSLEKADIKWYLSIDKNDINLLTGKNDFRTYRSVKIDGEEIEFSEGFTDLHTLNYNEILEGNGFGILVPCLQFQAAFDIRNMKPVGIKGEFHRALKQLK